ncbi:MAG TPA: carboxypeptidase-like regulatory domain-containing protein, partial [Cytophagales bacterium]|nr:carboxypeptidase-like regulatory domain-containing protein [Cytophagales bacterium]
MKKRNIFLISILLIFSGLSYAQVGSIRGQVIDDQSGEPLIGATVLVAGTTTGSPADLDGKFTLPNLQPGKYNIQTSFISYQTLTINEVEVKAGEVTILNIRLKTESVGLQEVVIEAKVQKSAESAMLTVQKKSGVVLDAISSEQFSRSGDSDAAAAMRRVTGI